MKNISSKLLPTALYSVQSIRQIETTAMNEFNIPSYELMKRAGTAVFNYLQATYPIASRILVCCGSGNNAGDGYVVAKLAKRAGLDVNVVSLVDTSALQGDAKTAWQDWNALGHQLVRCTDDLLQQSDVIIDALFGTGLQRDVEGVWATQIERINRSGRPVISVDIPSGLDADTGRVRKLAVNASHTVTFVGLKQGLFTHQGVDYCGELEFDALAIPQEVYQQQSAQAELLNWSGLKNAIKPRKASAHKHQCGHLLVLGGDSGMPGAVRLAAEAALRVGAGLVTVVSQPEHSAVLLAGRPEIILAPSADGHVSTDLLASADALIIGPGLTDSQWSKNIFADVLAYMRGGLRGSEIAEAADQAVNQAANQVDNQVDNQKGKQPLCVLDAGALRLLSYETISSADRAIGWVLTPHPGEAAALLDDTSASIQDSRFSSVQLLQEKYGGHIILKGAGSLLQSPDKLPQLNPYGNPGMASAGMGDVLSGVTGALLAQGYATELACSLGLCLHSVAADMAAVAEGEQGLLASDLYPYLRQLMNPSVLRRMTHDRD